MRFISLKAVMSKQVGGAVADKSEPVLELVWPAGNQLVQRIQLRRMCLARFWWCVLMYNVMPEGPFTRRTSILGAFRAGHNKLAIIRWTQGLHCCRAAGFCSLEDLKVLSKSRRGQQEQAEGGSSVDRRAEFKHERTLGQWGGRRWEDGETGEKEEREEWEDREMKPNPRGQSSPESPQLPGWNKEETQMEALIGSPATADIFTLWYDSMLLFKLWKGGFVHMEAAATAFNSWLLEVFRCRFPQSDLILCLTYYYLRAWPPNRPILWVTNGRARHKTDVYNSSHSSRINAVR